MHSLTPTAVRISVCVCTYRRPELLSSLLASLAIQNADQPFEVIVVDNDPQQSGKPAVSRAQVNFPHLQIRYESETRRGISHARNCAVQSSRGELIAWIDDDEIAVTTWLSDALKQLEQLDADAVFGPVVPMFPNGSRTWCSRSGLYERKRFRTGTRIDADHARTGNALMRAHWLRQTSTPFAVELSLTGGEDVDFFSRIESKGARFYWCDEAIVSEIVPLQRQRLGWLLERHLRSSANYWRQARHSLATRLAQGSVGLCAFGVFTLIGLIVSPFGIHRAVRYWSTAAASLGRVVALTTLRWDGY